MRCAWPGESPLQIAYHDVEWGTPAHDERALFELLTLEGAQAGLSWDTILRKREGYRRAFRGFDPEAVARLNTRSVDRLMLDAGIVRNRAKIESTISNARAILQLRGSLDELVWSFVPEGRPIQNAWRALSELPALSPESVAMSKELKRRGFRFVGSTTLYAFMQAAGLVNDHETGCFRWRELGGGSREGRGGRRGRAKAEAAGG